jgi:predicted nicotinamide N-methyase
MFSEDIIFLMNRHPSLPRMPSPELLNELCPFCPVPGCGEIQARRSSAVFALWEAWEKEAGQECPVPFWASVWPAAQVLARFLLDQPDLVRGQEVIEIGCGGAVASIAARKAGARRVTANDIDPVAIAIARQNGAQNRVSLQFDCENRIETGSVGQAQLILCSDFFYARSESLALAGLLAGWRDRSITILIGDGGRAFVPADYRDVLREEWVDADSDLEGREKRAVRILRY